MSKNTENTELQVKSNGYLKLADFDLNSAISEELDGLDLGFERIKIPSAGSTVFEVPSSDGDSDTDSVKDFEAVILVQHPISAYYASKYTGGNQPPECGSFDGKTGIGTPGGNCGACPYNKFGSGENGSKACKNRRRIYVLREGELFPMLLSLPTGSLKELTKYIKKLLSTGKRPNQVVTKFSLKKAVNSGGLAYSQAQFNVARPLTPAELPIIAKMSEQIKAFSMASGFGDENAHDADDLPFVDAETGEVIEPLK